MQIEKAKQKNSEIKRIIKKILIEKEKTRDSDMQLYFEYIKACGEQVTTDVLLRPERYGLGTYATISRTRRKEQELDRESGRYLIQPSSKVRQAKKKKEEEYRRLFGK